MKNWAGNLEFNPDTVSTPHSLKDIQEAVQKARLEKRNIRTRGSSHSWTSLVETKDVFLHLDNLQGIIEVQQESKRIRAWAGTKLYNLGEQAFHAGLALPNQGDINKQSLAGALSTGTHGTGIGLQSLSNQVKQMNLVLADGSVIGIDENHPYFQAARVSFGSLGIISDLTIQMIPAYKLKVHTFAEDMKTSLQAFSKRLTDNRHLEMFYFPVGDWSMVKIMNETKDSPTPHGMAQKFNDVVLENWLYEFLNVMASKTKAYKSIDSLMRKFVSSQTKVDWSHLAFPADRTVKFMEMEYNLPIEKFEEAFQEIKHTIQKKNFQTLFPIEIRFVKGDDIWLSPAFQRDSVYFAIHTYIREDYREYFNTMENIFKKYNGRPHWGKWHSLSFSDLEKVYPKWHDFLKIKQELDPEHLWDNSHLKKVLYP